MTDDVLPAAMPAGGLTTAEKIQRAVQAIRTIDLSDASLPADAREMIGGLQMAAGFGIDPLAMLIPADPNDADVMVDKAIALLLDLRGDDLPPFRHDRYGEGE